ncbi:MAG TPA: hypothetical protein VFR91_03895 [Dyella sp.]|nr:hypothetical protein [Dyella sp.]
MSPASRPVRRLARLFAAAALAAPAGCGRHGGPPSPATGADPVQALHVLIDDLRRNDLAAFWQDGLPVVSYRALLLRWRAEATADPVTPAERAAFGRQLDPLTAAGATATLAARLRTRIERLDAGYGDQVPVLVAIGGATLRNAVAADAGLSPTQQQGLEEALAPLVAWIPQAPWRDPARAGRVAGIAVDTLRGLPAGALDQLEAADFAAAMRRASRLFAGARRILAVYGLSTAQVLDSARSSLIVRQDTTAWIRVDYRLLDRPRQAVLRMRQVDGHWYPVVLEQFARALHRPSPGWWRPGPNAAHAPGIAGDRRTLPVQ